jgi:hypothetical protein
MYTYYADVVEVLDGDTVVMDWDLGRRTWARDQHFRLAWASARKLSMDGGPEAGAAVAALLPVGTRTVIRSIKLDRDPEDVTSFERYVVTIQLPDGRDLAAHLIAEQWAARWDGRSRPIPYPPWPRTVDGQP